MVNRPKMYAVNRLNVDASILDKLYDAIERAKVSKSPYPLIGSLIKLALCELRAAKLDNAEIAATRAALHEFDLDFIEATTWPAPAYQTEDADEVDEPEPVTAQAAVPAVDQDEQGAEDPRETMMIEIILGLA